MNCKHYESCSAPICPRNADSVKHCIWFPGEETCSLTDVPEWVKRQRKLSLYASKEGYFNADMLSHGFTIRKGIRGCDPDRLIEERAVDVLHWLREHPSPSKERLVAMRERAMKNLASSSGKKASSDASHRALEGAVRKNDKTTPPNAEGGVK